MDPISLGMGALSLGNGIASFFGGKGKKASTNLQLPSYQASQYDAPTSAQLYQTLSDRVAGKNVGFSKDDLDLMNSGAVDQSAKAENDMVNRGMAGRQNTGGITTGGTNVLRDKAVMAGSQLRANSLRDIGIQNAVLKRQEISAAIPQEQGFLNNERSNAEELYNNKMNETLIQKQEADKVQAYNQARTDSSNSDLSSLVGNVTSGFSGQNFNPFQFNTSSGANQNMFGLGQYLKNNNPFATNSGYGSGSNLLPTYGGGGSAY